MRQPPFRLHAIAARSATPCCARWSARSSPPVRRSATTARTRTSLPVDPAIELGGTLRIEFTRGDGELTIPIPAVPG